MSLTHTTAVRSVLADAVCNSSTGQLGSNFSTKLYSGIVLSGTVSISNGTANVTGSGTSWQTNTLLAQNQWVVFATDTTKTPYQINTVTSDTACTLKTNYTGTTLSGSNIWASPLNASGSLSPGTGTSAGAAVASTITNCNFGSASSGVSTLTSSTSDTSATGGTVIFGRMLTSGGTACVQFIISPTGNGGDMTMNTTVIASGATVGFSGTNTYTAPL
jgi:hypothetical protein